jgi:hypothetical protein
MSSVRAEWEKRKGENDTNLYTTTNSPLPVGLRTDNCPCC